LDQASISSRRDGPVYDAKYLSELRATTSSRPQSARDESQDTEMSVDIFGETTIDTPGAFGKQWHARTVSLLNVDSDPGFHLTGTDEIIIPAESSVKAAKEKRERLRKSGAEGAEDYISLSVTRHADEDQGPHPESRLVREDDELGEGDDGTRATTSNILNILMIPYRVCRVHECSGTYRSGQEVSKGRS
jgi:GC-rich sequence DNA-binding factor